MTSNVKYYLEDLEVGMKSSTSMVITGEKIDTFAELTGDKNPIHVDEEFAKTTMFEVIAIAEVAEINERNGRVKMKCYCEVNGKQICRGDAGVIVKKRPTE